MFIKHDIKQITYDVLSDIKSKCNANYYGGISSCHYRILHDSDSDRDIYISVTKETDGLDAEDYFYSIFLVDEITGTDLEVYNADFTKDALLNTLIEIQDNAYEKCVKYLNGEKVIDRIRSLKEKK